jgi:hypothetical protein
MVPSIAPLFWASAGPGQGSDHDDQGDSKRLHDSVGLDVAISSSDEAARIRALKLYSFSCSLHCNH